MPNINILVKATMSRKDSFRKWNEGDIGIRDYVFFGELICGNKVGEVPDDR